MKNIYWIFILLVSSLLSCWNVANETPPHTPIKAKERIIKPDKIIPETLANGETVAYETANGVYYRDLDTVEADAIGYFTLNFKITRDKNGMIKSSELLNKKLPTHGYEKSAFLFDHKHSLSLFTSEHVYLLQLNCKPKDGDTSYWDMGNFISIVFEPCGKHTIRNNENSSFPKYQDKHRPGIIITEMPDVLCNCNPPKEEEEME